ncbi:MAG: glycosyltransferase family 4 protein [Magnetospirillum sp. WYHS-4]
MKILSLLNVSNAESLLADSGFVFQKLLLEALASRGHEVLLLAPAEAARFTSVEIAPVPVAASKYHARLRLDFDCASVASHWWTAPDLVLLCNQPELALQLKGYSFLAARREVPLVSYVHYLPFWEEPIGAGIELDTSLSGGGLGPWIKAAVGMAVSLSEACIVGSEYGRRLIEAAYGPQSTLSVIPPPIEPELRRLVDRMPMGDGVRILYNHRIYSHYGTAELFQSLDRVIKQAARQVTVLVTAPTQHRSELRRALDVSSDQTFARVREYPFVELIETPTREAYWELVEQSHFGVAPARRSPLWSMAMADLLGAGRPVVSLPVGGYPEVLGESSANHCCKSEEFERALANLITAPPLPNTRISDDAWSRLSPASIAERFERVLAAALDRNSAIDTGASEPLWQCPSAEKAQHVRG